MTIPPKRKGWRPKLYKAGLYLASGIGLVAVASGAAYLFTRESVSEAASARCAALEGKTLGPAKVVSADAVAGGPTPSLMLAFIGIPTLDLPPSCRVKLTIAPVPGSKIATEVWMPAEGWNERYQGIGNGGLAGAVDYFSLTTGLHRGYAVAGSDTGHAAKDTDADWSIGNPVAVDDYGWRAIHETAVAAKKVIGLFYGRAPRYSYFGSGSNGGREGLMEAQRFPEDYDGILAGAPALDVVGTLPAWAWMQQIAAADPQARLGEAQLRLVNEAVMRECDGQDGVKDGVLENPPACGFRPASLLCASGQTDACLKPAQVRLLDAIYRGPTPDGRWGFVRGGELGWSNWIVGSKPDNSLQRIYVGEYIGKMTYGRTDWDVGQLDWSRDSAAMRRKLEKALNAENPDLSRFHARGGKLILYHGWSDPALPPGPVLAYYKAARAALGQAAGDSLRLYMVPGLDHVIGGPGPNVFGQLVPAGKARPTHDLGAALEAWVERGQAPGPVIATKYSSDRKPLVTQTGEVRRTRPLCPYPLTARWSGQGSTDDAANFACR
jgi:hypothetical protein